MGVGPVSYGADERLLMWTWVGQHRRLGVGVAFEVLELHEVRRMGASGGRAAPAWVGWPIPDADEGRAT